MEDITRMEINTYIQKWNPDKENYEKGTLILDYTSNALSMDPIHIFKQKESLTFLQSETKYIIHSMSLEDDIDFRIQFIPWIVVHKYPKIMKRTIDDNLIDFSDAIYYKNGIEML